VGESWRLDCWVVGVVRHARVSEAAGLGTLLNTGGLMELVIADYWIGHSRLILAALFSIMVADGAVYHRI